MGTYHTGRLTRKRWARVRALVLAMHPGPPWTCGICGEPVLSRPSVDHVVPISTRLDAYGLPTISELEEASGCQVVHRRCNSRKGARPPDNGGMRRTSWVSPLLGGGASPEGGEGEVAYDVSDD